MSAGSSAFAAGLHSLHDGNAMRTKLRIIRKASKCGTIMMLEIALNAMEVFYSRDRIQKLQKKEYKEQKK